MSNTKRYPRHITIKAKKLELGTLFAKRKDMRHAISREVAMSISQKAGAGIDEIASPVFTGCLLPM